MATSAKDKTAGTDHTVTTLLEDGAHTFTAAEFGFSAASDADSATGANALAAVKITPVPTVASGTLTDDDVSVLSLHDALPIYITAGKLVFTPAANANGTPEASFTFQVQDDGGT